MTVDIDVDIKASGPLFNGMYIPMTHEAESDAENDVAQRADALIDQRLRTVLRNPTGRFQRTIHVTHASDPYVDGEGTIYGRWLEGVGSRNATTRFKGYATFRLVTQKVDLQAGPIAERRFDRLARRL